MKLARRPLLATASSMLLLGPRIAFAWGETVKGSGTAASQHRDPGAFTGIALGASFDVVVRQANRESIDIRADDNLLALIETNIVASGDRRTLRIDLKSNTSFDSRTHVAVEVAVVQIESIALGGSGKIVVEPLRAGRLKASVGGSGSLRMSGLEARELDLSLGGSGDFQADGRAGKFSASIAGSGQCDAQQLIAEDVTISIAGSGDARIHADHSLHASIAGSGDVIYSGRATPSASIVGSGRLRKA
jgi:hypothetical protein